MPIFTSDTPRVFIGVDFHDFRMALQQPGPRRVAMQFPKLTTQLFLLIRSHLLVAETQDAPVGQRVGQLVNHRRRLWLREIDPRDQCSAVGSHRSNFQFL